MSDTRFIKRHTDPRFVTLPAKKKKVKLDSRFKALLTDKRFKSKAEFNKYGEREVHSDTHLNPELARIYQAESQSESQESEAHFEWDESSSSEDQVNEEPEEQYNWGELDDDAQLLQEGKETERLALQNINWEQFSAADLMKLFSSFCKSDMLVKSVAIYPTEIGTKKMKEDQLLGPQGVFKAPSKKVKAEEEGVLEDIFQEPKEKQEVFDQAALRKYELEKMEYFYAIISCNSIKTANHLYAQCSGLQLELSGCKLDLRYVPDSITQFPYKPKEVCSEVPEQYETKAGELNRTLNHSKVELTWEQEKGPKQAIKLLQKKLEDFDQDDQKQLKELVAGSSEDEEKEFTQRMKMFKDLLAETTQDKKENRKLEINFKSAFDVNEEEMSEEAQPQIPEKKKKLSYKGYKEKKKEVKREKKRKKKLEKFQTQVDKNTASKDELTLLMDEGTANKAFKPNPRDQRFKAIQEKREFAVDPTHKDYRKLGDQFKK